MLSPAVLALPGPAISAVWVAVDPAGTSGPGFDAGTLGQYGVLGIVNFILFRFAQSAYNREKQRADDADAEVKRLNAKIIDETSGTLAANNAAMQAQATALDRLADLAAAPRRRTS